MQSDVTDDLKSRDQKYKELKSAYIEQTEHNQHQLGLIKQVGVDRER